MKIAIIGAEFRDSDWLLCKAAQERNHTVFCINPSNIYFHITNNKIKLVNLPKVDRVLIRRTVEQSEKIALIAIALKSMGIPCIEQTQHYTSSSASKIGAILKRATQTKLPTSWAIWSLDQLSDLLNSSKKIRFPVLVKPDRGSGGVGIKKIDTYEELKSLAQVYFQKESGLPFLIQEEVKKKREYRVLVLNGQAIAIVLKCFSKNSIVANAAAGVSFIDARETQKYVSLDEVKNVETCAIEATKVHELMFAGVDIIISKNNENYVIECNRNPQFIETQRVLPDIDIANQVIKCLENPSEWAI